MIVRAVQRAAIALVAVTACGGGETAEVIPVVEVPGDSSDAHPYGDLDALVLSIAREGDDEPIALSQASPGDPLSLSDVPLGDELVVHLSGRAGGVEVAYGRTCSISVPPGTTAGERPRLYLSRIVKWSPWADISASADFGYALADGSAVFVSTTEGRARRYDPLSGEVNLVSSDLVSRSGAVVSAVSGDSALVVGGVNGGGDGVGTVEVLHPLQGERRELDGQPRLAGHAAVTLVDGSVLVTGGEIQAEPGAAFELAASAWLFRLGEGGMPDPRRLGAELVTPRAGHTLTRLGDEVGADVLVVGGLGADDRPVAAAELYRPLREAFEPITGAELVVPRHDHEAIRLPGGFVLVLGGIARGDTGPEPTRALEIYDPVQGEFSLAGELPPDAGVTGFSVTTLPDGRALMVGGADGAGEPVSSAYIIRLDPIDGRVDMSATDTLAAARAGHAAVRLCDGTVLLAGGGTAASERYNPASTGR